MIKLILKGFLSSICRFMIFNRCIALNLKLIRKITAKFIHLLHFLLLLFYMSYIVDLAILTLEN
jgi:hypothetical protein